MSIVRGFAEKKSGVGWHPSVEKSAGIEFSVLEPPAFPMPHNPVSFVDVNQIWFIDNKFGVSVRLSQVLCQQSAKLPSFAFQGLDGDDIVEEEYVEEEEEVDE